MIKRYKYIEKVRKFYDSDLVKVITGIRRSGKSVILNDIREEISKMTDNIVYLNFEKSTDFNKANNWKMLIDYVNSNRKQGKCYIFLDEIQEIKDWQRAIKDLRLENNSIFITGSNSKLLSKEILTTLSGRFINFRVRPFVYKEILEYAKQLNINVNISDYLTWGGFPARFAIKSIESQKDYLYDLQSTIVYNDIIKRHSIKKEVIFKKIVNYVLLNNARILSARNIHKYINAECSNVSLNTVLKYINYLKQAYIIDEISQYSTRTKKILSYYSKIYDSDVCFNSLSIINNRYDLNHNLENIVYNELIYRGYELKVYDTGKGEIDFIATKNRKSYLIQVAYSVVDQKAYEREFKVFNTLDNENKKILITTDEIDYSTSTVTHISLKDFLLMDDLESL